MNFIVHFAQYFYKTIIMIDVNIKSLILRFLNVESVLSRINIYLSFNVFLYPGVSMQVLKTLRNRGRFCGAHSLGGTETD